jgi:hypothetical protein
MSHVVKIATTQNQALNIKPEIQGNKTRAPELRENYQHKLIAQATNN